MQDGGAAEAGARDPGGSGDPQGARSVRDQHRRQAAHKPSSCSTALPNLGHACRTAVLRKLGHVTKEGVVTLKGRAACEISTGDELLTTELMFNGVFNSLDKHQLVALLSCSGPSREVQCESFTTLSVSPSLGTAGILIYKLMFNGVFNSLDKHQLVALLSCLVPVEKSNVSTFPFTLTLSLRPAHLLTTELVFRSASHSLDSCQQRCKLRRVLSCAGGGEAEEGSCHATHAAAGDF